MKTRCVAVLTALALTLTLAASNAEAGKGKKKKPVGGVVTEVVTKEDGQGTISLKVMAKKKAATTPSDQPEKKFSITKDTKFETMVGKKKGGEIKPATAKDVSKKARILVVAGKDGVAEKVTIMAGKKKAKG
jgi:hypothetical protein